MKNKAFTLIEMLVVIFIIAAVTAIVAPNSFKLYSKFENYLYKKEQNRLKNKLAFYEFITDSNCKIDNNSIICE